MNWFHTRTRGLGPESFKVVSVLDREVFGAVIGVRGEDRKAQVGRAASKCFEKLESLKVQMPICPFALATLAEPPATAGSPSSAAALVPKVIRLEGGKPVTSQDVVETKVFAEKIKGADFFKTDEARLTRRLLWLPSRGLQPFAHAIGGRDAWRRGEELAGCGGQVL